MVEKIIKDKMYIISVAIVLLLTIFFANIKYLLPKKYGKIPEVKLREIKDTRAFAIMIPNESGDGYVEYSENTWPSEEYAFKEAKCVDNNGIVVENAITFESATKTAILETDKTVSCTLYFDKFIPINLRELCENYDNMQTCIEHEKGNMGKVATLSSNLQGDMYRYQGLDKQYENDEENNPTKLPVVKNNYICFGTTDSEECSTSTDKYMYRIIGITEEGQLKLIKEELLQSGGEILTHEWNDLYELSSPYDGETGDCDGDKCEWPNTTLFKDLNGIGENNIFVNSGEYDFLYFILLDEETNEIEASEWYNLIANHNWPYGDAYDWDSDEDYNGNGYYLNQYKNRIYEIETGKRVATRCWPELGGESIYDWEAFCNKDYLWRKIQAKVGIIYYSDFVFAYFADSNFIFRNDFNQLGTKIWIFGGNNPINIYNSVPCEWLMNRGIDFTFKLYSFGSRLDGNSGAGGLFSFSMNSEIGVRPTFYLTPEIKIKSGDGTESDPFILEAE